ncbi:enterotoxin [Granulicella sp. L60]|uniref:enterotoxin n=1 Tax=Granulicella sp. L60 TaxID=1641866 RepID=UPI00131C80B4|nr:enterotoxin [Granulicella sp. L60]
MNRYWLLVSTLLSFPLVSSVFGIAQSAAVQAEALRVHVNVRDKHFVGWTIRDTISGREIVMKDAFTLVLKDHGELHSSEMQVQPLNDTSSVIDSHRALSSSQLATAETKRCWQFHGGEYDVDADWCVVTRPGSDYVRSLIRVTAAKSDLPVAEVRLLEFRDAGAHVEGNVHGSPVVDANFFFGFEHPLSTSNVSDGLVKVGLLRELSLRAGQSITYSAVLGAAQPGQLRREFLAYLENERPRRYEPFLHYNSWFDLGYQNRFDEKSALDRVNAFGQQLVVDRNVKLDSYLFDDGWDDPNALWGFNPGFPNGFTKTSEAAAKYKAGIGVWLSPWGGYDEQKKERVAYGTAHGYEIMNEGYALSGTKYYERFEQTCFDMVDRYHVNQFKFDGTGNANRVFPGSDFDSDFDAAIHLIERLRKKEPSIFINLTTGTTASPFWLFYADSIWRGGEDHDFSGVGSARQRWITYRDAQTYKNIVERGPLFPLNSLMLHGIIYAKQAKDLMNDPRHEFADEVHSYFGSGTQLQEMYITPDLLTTADWDMLADSARWSRAHAETLKDTHWIGGDPDKLEIYGWAAWSPKLSLITLRNPSGKPQKYMLDLAKVLELKRNAPERYNVHGVWNDVKDWQPEVVRPELRDRLIAVELTPFEVLTLEATPAH